LQAAILSVKLKYLSKWGEKRRLHAQFYDQSLRNINIIKIPTIHSKNQSVYNQYTIRVPNRDLVAQKMKEMGVGTNIYYPEALHTQPALNNLGYKKEDFPKAEKAAREVLSLPIFPELSVDERTQVVKTLISCI